MGLQEFSRCAFLRFLFIFSLFSFVFLWFSHSPRRQGQTSVIYLKNGEFHSDPVCTDPVQIFLIVNRSVVVPPRSQRNTVLEKTQYAEKRPHRCKVLTEKGCAYRLLQRVAVTPTTHAYENDSLRNSEGRKWGVGSVVVGFRLFGAPRLSVQRS